MSGNKLLFDSNILIYLSKNLLKISNFAEPNDSFYMSVVTYIEVFGYDIADPAEKDLLERTAKKIGIVLINFSLADKAIEYRKIKKIKLPDAVILATAKIYDCTLITRNIADFQSIDSTVKILNPFDNSSWRKSR